MNWLRGRSTFIIVSSLLGLMMVLFLILPLVTSIFGAAGGFWSIIYDQRTLNALTTSLLAATIATIFTLALGVPLAYLMVRYDFTGKRLIETLIDIPLLIPHNAAGIALLSVLSSGTLLGGVAASIGISFVDTTLGIVVAMVFVSAPFLIRSAQEAFYSIDPDLEKVARSLGASSGQVFREVQLPLAYPGILTGCLLTWARAMSEFGAVVILAYYPKTLPVYLNEVLAIYGLRATLPIIALLIVLATVILLIFRMITKRRTLL